LPAVSRAQSYPERPVRIIVGFGPGTGPDIVARLLAQKLSERWNKLGVVVDNKPGAGGLIAANEAAHAVPDGYTLMLAETGQLAIAPNSYRHLPYDASKDFIPVSQVVTSDFVLLVNPKQVPARDIRQFVEWSKAQPRGLFMGSFGAGSPGHFGTHLFGEATGLKAEPVHYKTTSDALGGIMSGDVAGAFASVGLSMGQLKGGKMIALGVAGKARSRAMPEVPTFAEQGYPQVRFSSWYGIVAPAHTPPEIVAKLEADVRAAMRDPDNRARIETAGFTPTDTSSADFTKFIAGERAMWGRMVTATGFHAD
jgi:tripartite-type tricarboxylate transporter receptor subunit TctC